MKLPSSLVAELKERNKNADGGRWVFPSKHGLPEGHFLRKLKKIALRRVELWTLPSDAKNGRQGAGSHLQDE